MSRYVIARRADRDLDAIWELIRGSNGIPVANRIELEFHETMQMLAEHPMMGHTRTDVADPRYRFWSVYKFVIGYRIDKKPIHIARVVHGARQFARLFR
jgi:plasmid stabilization system protein ParE